MQPFQTLRAMIPCRVVGVIVVILLCTSPGAARNRSKPKPTRADVRYGPHERNVDFFNAKLQMMRAEDR